MLYGLGSTYSMPVCRRCCSTSRMSWPLQRWRRRRHPETRQLSRLRRLQPQLEQQQLFSLYLQCPTTTIDRACRALRLRLLRRAPSRRRLARDLARPGLAAAATPLCCRRPFCRSQTASWPACSTVSCTRCFSSRSLLVRSGECAVTNDPRHIFWIPVFRPPRRRGCRCYYRITGRSSPPPPGSVRLVVTARPSAETSPSFCPAPPPSQSRLPPLPSRGGALRPGPPPSCARLASPGRGAQPRLCSHA